MIAWLSGIVRDLSAANAVIDVNGVGYLVGCSGRTLGRLRLGGSAEIHVETHVSEDAIRLYGFLETEERDWFRLLQTVQGVGARVALSVLTALTPAQLAAAIASGDKAMLGRADGVGPKLAQRLAAELKDKAGGLALGAALKAQQPVTGGKDTKPVAADNKLLTDATSALVNLGYGRADAYTAVAKAASGGIDNLDKLIPAALKELMS
ncbi:Holliday junction branch migration protein RuvA [Lacibacterium aquatile]|uniref:Holliday junction branch migration complex subunit RuvA n=1 Tax=Lacibacterium aquatile TaxID=1168082 RepID=A0ABW5DWM2_9PROT